MREDYPEAGAGATPAETFESLTTGIMGLQADIVAIAVGGQAYNRAREKRELRTVFHEVAPELLADDIFKALEALEQGKDPEEYLPVYQDEDINEVVKFETGLDTLSHSILSGKTLRRDRWGVYLTTERKFSMPKPGVMVTTFKRYRSHEGNIVHEYYIETGNMPAAGEELDEFRRRRVEQARSEGQNGMAVSPEKAREINEQLATLHDVLVELKASGRDNIRQHLQ